MNCASSGGRLALQFTRLGHRSNGGTGQRIFYSRTLGKLPRRDLGAKQVPIMERAPRLTEDQAAPCLLRFTDGSCIEERKEEKM